MNLRNEIYLVHIVGCLTSRGK